MSATHEDFRRDTHGRGASDRSFGLVVGTVLSLIGLLPLVHRRPLRVWFLAPGVALVLIALARPAVLHGLNRVWTRLGILLGRIVNPIFTAVLFYVVFAPIAIVLRWMGKDLLGLSLDRNAKSYWIQRDTSVEASSMTNQF